MKIDFETFIPVSDTSKHDCFQELIVNAGQLTGREIEMFFSDSWRFRFNLKDFQEHGGTFGEHIDVATEYSNEYLLKYHGMSVSAIALDQMNNGSSEVLSSLWGELPLIIYVDNYIIPWGNNYLQSHNPHFIMVVGYDSTNHVVQCVDPMFSKKIEVFPAGVLIQYMIGDAVYKIDVIEEDWTQQSIDYIQDLKTLSHRMYSENRVEDILTLSKLIDEFGFDVNREFKVSESDDFWNCSILLNLRKVIFGRYYFARALCSLGLRYTNNDLHILANKADEICKKWENIRLLLFKSYYTKKINSKDLARRLRNISIEEEQFIATLLNNDLGGLEQSTETNFQLAKEFSVSNVNLNLEPLFNNKGIFASDGYCADLTGLGEFFIENQSTTTTNKFSPKVQERLDNISCDAEIITLPTEMLGYYDLIYVVGCSEWGDSSDILQVVYEDDSIVSFPLNLTDWGAEIPRFGEAIVWEGNYGKIDDGKGAYLKRVFLYNQIIKVNKDKKIKRLQLPQCSNIHIFSIELGSSAIQKEPCNIEHQEGQPNEGKERRDAANK